MKLALSFFLRSNFLKNCTHVMYIGLIVASVILRIKCKIFPCWSLSRNNVIPAASCYCCVSIVLLWVLVLAANEKVLCS